MKAGNKNILRIVRVAVSSVVFILFLALFLDVKYLSQKLAGTAAFFQFTPSLIRFLAYGVKTASVGFILVLVLTLLFGRIYCSGLCPLGTLQDLLLALFRKRHQAVKPYLVFRTFFFIFLSVASLTGTMVFLNLFEPHSAFGRIVVNLAKPVLVRLYHLLVSAGEATGFYDMHRITLHAISSAVLAPTLLFAAGLSVLVFFKGRIFCNLFCPVGFILGFVSRFSFFRMRLDDQKCTNCRLCEKVCKAGCIDSKEGKLDASRCVSCFNCLEYCSSGSIRYGRGAYVKASGGRERRETLFRLVLLMAGLFLPLKKLAGEMLPSFKFRKKYPVTPPGSAGISRFTARCTACHLCVSSCPTGVLSPSLFQYGMAGLMQPHMDYSRAFCEFECTVCGRVCPTGALLPLSRENKKTTQIGQVNLVRRNCIVYRDKKECGSCSEHCPTKAVYLVPYGHLMAPEINTKICIGCGACENVCPARPFKAIYVEGNATHRTAQKPGRKQLRKKGNSGFPF